jgi:hypothetical protein
MYRLALEAGGEAVLDPEEWFGRMTAKTALGWLMHYAVEPFGNRERGMRTGRLALATGLEKGSEEDFIVSDPTEAELRDRQKWEEQVAEFYSWSRGG